VCCANSDIYQPYSSLVTMEDIMAIVMMEILWVRRSLEVECPLDHILNIDNVYTYTFGGFGGCFIYLLILFLSRLE